MKATIPVRVVSGAVLRYEVSRFIRAARERCESDNDRRRRGRRRYYRSWPLLVAAEDHCGGPDMCVALYNASPMGIAFLCPRAIAVGTTVLVKLFWHDDLSPYVPAVVRHATRNHHGHLIGCVFALEGEGSGPRALPS
jgi:hypothetical protein